MMFFSQTADNSIFFSDLTRKVLKNFKIQKNIKIVIFDQKLKLVIHPKFWFFTNVWNFLKSFLFYLKRQSTCQLFAKRTIKIEETVLEISYFEKKKHRNLASKFRPLRTQMAPNFHFSRYLQSVTIKKSLIYYEAYKLC